MSPVEYTADSIRNWLARPEHAALAQMVHSDLEYMVKQYGRSRQKEYLILATTKSIIERTHQAEAIPADSPSNKEPF